MPDHIFTIVVFMRVARTTKIDHNRLLELIVCMHCIVRCYRCDQPEYLHRLTERAHGNVHSLTRSARFHGHRGHGRVLEPRGK